MSWQPIETAPKDGTEIIIGVRDRRMSADYKVVANSCWMDEDDGTPGHWFDWDCQSDLPPSHWMTLPKFP